MPLIKGILEKFVAGEIQLHVGEKGNIRFSLTEKGTEGTIKQLASLVKAGEPCETTQV